MNIKYKRVLIIIFIAIISIIAMPNKINAGLQANNGGASLYSTTTSAFFTGMRRMETQYGTLGKNAVLDEKYLDTTGNGIDSHMILNTEWGTVALLTDSIFGIGTEIKTQNTATSTGNASGVYNLANGGNEFTASSYIVASNDKNASMIGADRRYCDIYGNSSEVKPGDAMECKTWLGGSMTNTSYQTSIRGNGSLFGIYFAPFGSTTTTGSRAVVVCGEGL